MIDDLQDEQAKVVTASLVILATVAVAMVMYLTQSVMIPFVLALMLASVVSPMVDFLVLRLHQKRAVAVLITLLIVLLAAGFFTLIIAYAGQQMITTAGRYTENLDRLVESIQAKLTEWNPNLDADKFINAQADTLINKLKTSLPGILSQSFGRTVSLFSSLVLVSIFLVFLLAGRNPHVIRKGMYAEMDQQIRGYISTKILLSVTTGLLVWITLAFLGLDLALVFGLLAFLLNFIPSIGSIIATVLPLPIAVMQFGGSPWHIIGVLAIPGAIQMGIGNGLEPKLLGKELQLHPITILLALSVWGLLWGLVGMLLAVPIMAVLRIILMRFETTRAIGELLAGNLPGNDVVTG